MSDGGFDVDKLLKQRRESENLFGIITDPLTGLRVTYPYIPNVSVKHTEQYLNDGDEDICQICNCADKCRLVEQGFFDLCRQNS